MQIEDEAETTFRTELIALIPHMRAFAISLCRDYTEASDLAQEAVTKALAARKSFTPGTSMKAWVFMIVRNQFYSERRRSWRSVTFDPEMAERELVAQPAQDAILELDELRRALDMLPERQREALILVGAGGMSYEEAGEVCGVPLGTIKSRVSRARDELSTILFEGRISKDENAPSAALGALLANFDKLRDQTRNHTLAA
jgi:RNA polymerase sigma-70 factor (ECF subfamily)